MMGTAAARRRGDTGPSKEQAVFTSPYPSVEVPQVSVYDELFGTLGDADLDRVALIDPGQCVDLRA